MTLRLPKTVETVVVAVLLVAIALCSYGIGSPSDKASMAGALGHPGGTAVQSTGSVGGAAAAVNRISRTAMAVVSGLRTAPDETTATHRRTQSSDFGRVPESRFTSPLRI